MSVTDLDTAIAGFRSGSPASGEELVPANWSDEDWKELFRFTSTRRIKAGDMLIRRGDPDRTLYFVLRGDLEVVVHSADGMSMGPLTRICAGSVLGEQSFSTAARAQPASGQRTIATSRQCLQNNMPPSRLRAPALPAI